ncbi:dTDP-4-amino-4,6-dideoxygalactose transaminase [Paenibacillus sp. yr247]|uniref:DegT/DnrJ/EryC1/StrS family aminotransferase n=1 Tax=Paenibacillus sp. yr247 TaxID=1761880 RepID=UPI000883BCA6|nr:DegT/DnrJ/EryC1/StrS family aminotransferase [Paenibacillus sp. yr247]SDO37823.1 dTDP-4-amino-4,6-dideoxygalactose transaminase [Paenibacillus sp. yr247]
MEKKLAIHGGKAVRNLPLPPMVRGGLVLGEEEAKLVEQVVLAKSPFRYYGLNSLNCVTQLEDQMAADFNVPYVLGVTSGTSALIVALKALGIGYGDKVIIPANTFTATAGSVICCNAVPVYADIDESMNMDPDDLDRIYDEEVKAIIAVHINGNPCDMDRIMAFARKHSIYVIEDVAQSLGTKYKGQQAGTIGDIGAYSFQMQKVLTAGEGGAIATRNPEWFERAVRYHDQGGFREKSRYQMETTDEANGMVGQNYRMSELTGAVLLEQWKKLDFIISTAQKHHRSICKKLQESIPGIQLRKSMDIEGDSRSVLGIFLPTSEKADEFSRAVEAESVTCFKMYGGKPVYMIPYLMNKQTVDRDHFPFNYPFRHPVIYEKGMCPRAENLLSRYVHIPINPMLTEADADDIAEAIIKVYIGLGLA